jgi:hypothetical protein
MSNVTALEAGDGARLSMLPAPNVSDGYGWDIPAVIPQKSKPST